MLKLDFDTKSACHRPPKHKNDIITINFKYLKKSSCIENCRINFKYIFNCFLQLHVYELFSAYYNYVDTT